MTTIAHKFFETANSIRNEKENKAKQEWEDKLSLAREEFERVFIPKIEQAASEGLFGTIVSVYTRDSGLCIHAMICVINDNGFSYGGYEEYKGTFHINVSWSNPGLKGNR